MKNDAYNMSKDGEYSGKIYPLKQYYYKIGKIILAVSDSDEGKLLEILKNILENHLHKTFRNIILVKMFNLFLEKFQ